MCGEFYPGWYDTWGAPHHLGDTPRYLRDLETMLEMKASFSIYMAHGGTTFGLWAGADRPFKPDTSSYDYDAPISEAGWTTEKFKLTRDLLAKYLAPGETLPEPPARLPVTSIPEFTLEETAPIFANLPKAIADREPRHMEAYDQGHGCTVYRTMLPAGPAATLGVKAAHDFAWVFLDGKEVGSMDRRQKRYSVSIPERKKPAQLDILVEAMGHVNFGPEIHDRKGIAGPVTLTVGKAAPKPLGSSWQVFPLKLDDAQLAGLKWKKGPVAAPAFWRGSFTIDKPADTFLDLRTWGKGVIWVNGRCLARYWNIGPTQTAFLPGAWLKAGRNEVVVLDLEGPQKPVIAGLETPILDMNRPELDVAAPRVQGRLLLSGVAPVKEGEFPASPDATDVKFDQPVTVRQICLEAVDAHDGKPIAAAAEFDLLDASGKSISHTNWNIVYASSEERLKEDGSSTNAIDGQTANYWRTKWEGSTYPHHLVIDLGGATTVAGFRYVPKAGEGEPGRIRKYRIYAGEKLVEEPAN
jgi:beta-galactosidase